MSEFTPITTQEEFDKAIGARLQRERETAIKPFADYNDLRDKVAGYEKKIGEYEKTIGETGEKLKEHEKTVSELNEKIKGYEVDAAKTRIALEVGLPMELKDRLSGNSDEEIRKDAEQLSKLFRTTAPLANSEGVQTQDDKENALRGLAKNLC